MEALHDSLTNRRATAPTGAEPPHSRFGIVAAPPLPRRSRREDPVPPQPRVGVEAAREPAKQRRLVDQSAAGRRSVKGRAPR
eukprot:gene10820-3688_t